VLAGEPGGAAGSGDDVRGRGDVDLDGAAEPCPVPLAGPLVCREVNGDRVVLPVPGDAALAGGGGAEGRAPVVMVPGECGKRMPEGVLGDAGERGQAACAAGLRQTGFRDVVAGGGPGGEPRRQDIGDRAERQVIRGGRPGEVGGDGLAGDRGDTGREDRGPLFACGGDGLPGLAGPAGGGDAVAAELAGERGVASGVAEGGDLAVQPGAAQVTVVGGPLQDVGGERGVGVRMRAGAGRVPGAR